MSLIDDIVEAEAGFAHDANDPRWMLLKLHKASEEAARLKRVLAEITIAYERRISSLEEREAEARDALCGWIVHENDGKAISFPDVGRAHLRSVAASVKVTDREMAEHVALELGMVKQVPDMQGAKERVMAIVTGGSGEVPPGFEFVAERKTLVVSS